MPNTPTPVRGPRTASTELQNQRPDSLDGTSFQVYDDSLPRSVQPQTPADLTIRTVVTEHDAAYTAPPGVVRSNMRSRLRSGRNEMVEPGEQSPTARAMGMRERRERELMRSVRAEGMRLERLRQQDRERIARGLDGNDDDSDGPGPAIVRDAWRDDLEGDRVGEENWESEAELHGWVDRPIRVVSGNAQRLQQRFWRGL